MFRDALVNPPEGKSMTEDRSRELLQSLHEKDKLLGVVAALSKTYNASNELIDEARSEVLQGVLTSLETIKRFMRGEAEVTSASKREASAPSKAHSPEQAESGSEGDDSDDDDVRENNPEVIPSTDDLVIITGGVSESTGSKYADFAQAGIKVLTVGGILIWFAENIYKVSKIVAALGEVISKRGQRSNVKFEIAEAGSVWADPEHAKKSFIGITARCIFTGGASASLQQPIPYVPSFISMPARDSDIDKHGDEIIGHSFPTSLGFEVSVTYCKLGCRVLILNDGVGQLAVGATIAEGEGFAQVAADLIDAPVLQSIYPTSAIVKPTKQRREAYYIGTWIVSRTYEKKEKDGVTSGQLQAGAA
ncbi:hypothetical protein M427DRAFT_39907 [Gonapodya prolifera JEL478]|uniref:Uncharacterized protein n=1 Tax=Gonapodya prolifera (strain JEL478) TaxID=1344416 RepID=A0A138ZWE6_GONPJ|nr:hypothetical protein M427DRAFT_39907 [Gonapodya prolifera JEL478]|eukprot:KXS08829.1 hypothetical protein M427DRAFT_39907 [Gonapodya prolifera JEL478]